MKRKNALTITRRGFTVAMGAFGLSIGLKVPAFGATKNQDSADALLHLRADGKIIVYSGAGHIGPYAGKNMSTSLMAKITQNEDVTFALFGNPAQLPAMLGQHIHHMSFTNVKTNDKALKILLNARKTVSNEVRYIIEEGISQKTCDMIKSLSPEGIIVAVRQRT
ncbi:MAG: hypothetical protein JKY84_13105 [Emcibacteraceae bacterium]|nr:hypothetical protein [Emcibacteraceae bacterium]